MEQVDLFITGEASMGRLCDEPEWLERKLGDGLAFEERVEDAEDDK